MKNKIDLTTLIDGTENGMLKVKVFAFLNERYDSKPTDMNKLKQDVNSVLAYLIRMKLSIYGAK